MNTEDQINAESRLLQDIPVEPFLADLQALCRTVFGRDWTPRSADPAATEHLRQYGFLPGAFLAFYETVGGEQRLLDQGLLPGDQTYIHHPARIDWVTVPADCLVYYRPCPEETWAFSRVQTERPSNGIFSHNDYQNRDDHWSSSDRRQHLGDSLLQQTGDMLSRLLPHCVWVKTTYTQKRGFSQYQFVVQRLGFTPLSSISMDKETWACDEERGLLLGFNWSQRKMCLVYGRTPEALEELQAVFPIVWERRDGRRVWNPDAFLHTEPPKTFPEKLALMSAILLGKRSMALPMSSIEKAERRLGQSFPEPLREFYLRFGKGGALLTQKALHTIYTPSQLKTNALELLEYPPQEGTEPFEGDLILARENQGVWYCRLDRHTGLPYLDMGDGTRQDMEMDLEDALLFLLAQQSMGYFSQGGPCVLSQTQENREMMSHFFHFLNNGGREIFVNPERRLIGLRQDPGRVIIMARTQTECNRLEADTGLRIQAF